MPIELMKDNGISEIVQSYPGMNIINDNYEHKIVLFEGTRFINCHILLGKDVYIKIEKSVYDIHNLRIWCGGGNANIEIGRNFSCWSTEIRCHESGCSVKIGEKCMFSEEILIYPTDVHAIYDIYTKQVLNRAKPIQIGNHVWCGRRVSILKGTVLQNDVVIGMGSVVSGRFRENNIAIAGSPARIVRRGINWDRRSPVDYKDGTLLSHKIGNISNCLILHGIFGWGGKKRLNKSRFLNRFACIFRRILKKESLRWIWNFRKTTNREP